MEGRTFLMLCLVVTFLEIANCTPYKHRGPPPPPGQVDVKDEPKAMDLDHGPPPPPPNQGDEMDEPVEMNLPDSQKSIILDDMILTQSTFEHRAGGERTRRQAFDDDYKWPKSGSTVIIPYVISGSVNQNSLTRAIEVFNAKTCIRFVPRDSQKDYVSFQSGASCNANVGYRGNGQAVCQLSSSCGEKKGKILHEMMHILNFLHEQCRPDRDNHITIHTQNIKTGAESNFDTITGKNMDIPYDCDSILQYKSTAFSSNGQPTITSSSCSKLGNDDTRLSLLDYKRVNSLYACDNPVYRYFTVKVDTDSSWLSGTDCFIYLKLHGTQRESSEFELDLDDAGSSDLFESGTSSTFRYMAYRDDLGPITGISVRMVSKGQGPSWWPNLFTITDPVNNQVVEFGNTKWLDPPSTYGPSTFPRK